MRVETQLRVVVVRISKDDLKLDVVCSNNGGNIFIIMCCKNCNTFFSKCTNYLKQRCSLVFFPTEFCFLYNHCFANIKLKTKKYVDAVVADVEREVISTGKF